MSAFSVEQTLPRMDFDTPQSGHFPAGGTSWRLLRSSQGHGPDEMMMMITFYLLTLCKDRRCKPNTGINDWLNIRLMLVLH